MLILLAACHQDPGQKILSAERGLPGNWGFLDPNGNYNEAFFGDSTYVTYNRIYGLMPGFNYKYSNDSLWSTLNNSEKGMAPVAGVEWLNENRLVIHTRFHSDTLERITGGGVHLGNTDPLADSLLFREAFNLRYEDFLVRRGILTREEIESFKRDSIIPEDVQQKMQGS